MLKHRYVKTIKKLGLLKDLKSFNDVQHQIKSHSKIEKNQGDAFEVFAEAYLKLGTNVNPHSPQSI